MNRIVKCCTAFLLCALPLAGIAAAEGILFRNVTVIPMSSPDPLPGYDVYAVGGQIARVAVAGSIDASAATTVIDGSGKFLMPGLAEMHAHIGAYPDATATRTLDLFLANGVTTVRSMLGHPSHLVLRAEAASAKTLAPRLVASGPSFNGRSVSGPEQARGMVEEQVAAGYDFLKLHPGLSPAEFSALATTARAKGIPFAGHVSLEVGLATALSEQQATIDHLDGYFQAMVRDRPAPTAASNAFFGVGLAPRIEPELLRSVALATAAAGVWNVVTETLFENLLGTVSVDELSQRGEMRYVPGATVTRWANSTRDARASVSPDVRRKALEVRERLILELHRAGAGLLLGSDSPQTFNVPGFALHRELVLLVRSGLTPYEALATGTSNVAAFFGEAGRSGVVLPGARADLLLLDANPLDDIRNTQRIAGVLLADRYLDRAALDEIQARHRRE